MDATLVAQMMAVGVRGFVVPLVWIVGIALIIAGIVSLVRGSLAGGLLLVVIGVLLGGLNIV